MLDKFDHYVGIDRVPDAVQQARRVYPERTFHELDLAEVTEKFDWVLGSQLLNHRTYQNHETLMRLVEMMWSISRKGVGFSVRVAATKNFEGPELFEYDPARVLTDCRKSTRSITCRMDYLPHDATFHLFH